MARAPKGLTERVYGERLLLCMGVDPATCRITAGDRPDLIVTLPSSATIGLEITQALREEHGQLRSYECAVAEIHAASVEAYIVGHGGRGAVITGSVHAVPAHSRELEGVPAQIYEHLCRHGGALKADGGVLSVRFEHAFGCVEHVQRMDRIDVFWLSESGGTHLDHKTKQRPEDVEGRILQAVRVKVGKAAAYAKHHPLWLGVRNPYAHLTGVSAELIGRVRLANSDAFARIVVFNDAEDVIHAGFSREPTVFDLL